MSKLEHIAAFIAVVEESGFAAAARKQGLSTAAISRHVSHLERDLKTELLKRTTRHVRLTEVGQIYYQQCKRILSELTKAELTISGNLSEATGTLSVTSNRYFAMQYLMPRLPEFMSQNPKLKITFELAERFPDLSREGIDILFGVSMEGANDLVRRRVATTRYVICASPKYLKKMGTPIKPMDLTHHQYISHSKRTPDNILRFKNDETIHLDPFLKLNDSRAMQECAIKHMGIICVHDYIVKDALKNGKLIEILQKYQEPEQFVYLYYQQSRYLQPKIRRFIDFYTT